ncbi:YbjN domain-containing protein [Cognatishimia activa]|uniref:YbjN domain-containing protein n=1 Tax=Cognatishimia activa TaxID=1715691 RepID=A0A975EQJ9_9RHOB|nr:YbjN domain-containing protein [Cognatishimia activa]MCH2250284.1 YbjN domain-containing protein [Cognatishimia sp.]NQY58868.1 YbjN domain-containing protein [Cognatishimia sp.]QTN36481.1 YbjN domain-containing protein [Cognatishimia activa]
MALSEQYLEEDIHPIDIVEHIAEHHEWTFDRIADDQIAMAIEGQWKTYSITLAWSGYEEMLKMVCSFEMEPPSDRMPQLFEVLNAVNDQCWAGGFTYWTEQNMMIYRYGLVLAGGQVASPDQIDTMINAAIMSAERFYPAIQLATWGGRSVEDAMQVAIAQAYGRA